MIYKDIDLEAIGVNNDDPINEKLEDFVSNLENLNRRSILPPNREIRKDKKIDKLMDVLEKELTDRFGITYRFYGTDHGAHCIITPPPENNIIMPESKEIFNLLSGLMKRYSVPSKNNISKIKKDDDYEEIYSSLHNSLLKIEESFIGDQVSVDFNKGNIKGLNKEVIVLLGIPFKTYLNFGLTVREIVAIIMHEIGHGFYSISSMHQMATTVVSVSDSIMDNKPDEKELIKLVSNVYNFKVNNPSELFTELFSDDVSFKHDTYFKKNNEASADQFATRFGYGEDLTTALSKFYNLKMDSEELTRDNFVSEYLKTFKEFLRILLTSIIVAYTVSILLITMLLISPVVLAYAMIKYLVEITSINMSLTSVSPNKIPYLVSDGNFGLSDKYDSKSPYDDLKQRFRRIKIDMIRQIRVNKISKKLESRYIDQITNIEVFMSQIEQEKGLVDLLGHILLFRRKEVGSADFFMRIEEMVENDFHITHKQFKNILKG